MQQIYRRLKPEFLLADRGYDGNPLHKWVHERGIKPIIPPRRPTADDGLYDGLYNRRGAPVCGDGNTTMEYLYTNPDNMNHAFACPPVAVL